jgi:hypothetical protein
MDHLFHRVVGIYPDRETAETAHAQMVNLGLAPRHISLLEGSSAQVGTNGSADSNEVLDDLLRDGAIGTAVGTAAGAGVSFVLAAANLTLFIASPVLSALYLAGWGASLGGLVGAVAGAQATKGDVPQLIKDALKAGHVVLVIHAYTDAETTRARDVVGRFADPMTSSPAGPATRARAAHAA